MTLSKAAQAEIAEQRSEAIKYLRSVLAPGDTVAVIVAHVSRSGMQRAIIPLIAEDGAVRNVSWAVARAIGWKFSRDHGGVTVDGCGMDMGFHLVYTLSRTLFSDGFLCIGEGTTATTGKRDRCPSNDHSNRDPRGYGPDVHHADGGYALRHSGI